MRSSTKNATNITLDPEPTKTRSSKHYNYYKLQTTNYYYTGKRRKQTTSKKLAN
jgi:hypothetical protein